MIKKKDLLDLIKWVNDHHLLKLEDVLISCPKCDKLHNIIDLKRVKPAPHCFDCFIKELNKNE